MRVRAAKHVATIFVTMLVAGFLGALLVRIAPGFDVDERALDSRLSAASIEAMRAEHEGEGNVFRYYAKYLSGAVRGDLGSSRMLHRPIAGLVRERAGLSAVSLVYGWAGGWFLGFGLALLVSRVRSAGLELASSAISSFFLCVPAAVLALAFLILRAPGRGAIAFIVFPKVFRHARNLLAQSSSLPHVITARAKGLSEARILCWHVLPSAAPQLLGLAGVTISIAIGAAIPVEVICDSPGIGQLAWQAALARDLPLLVNVTLLVTLVTMIANSCAEFVAYSVTQEVA